MKMTTVDVATPLEDMSVYVMMDMRLSMAVA